MIYSLRQTHRRIFSVLGVLLPLVLVIGIVARRSVPQIEVLPPELSSSTQTFTATDTVRDDLFAKAAVTVRIWKDLQSGQLAVGFSAPRHLLKPDLLVYWTSSGTPLAGELPADAVLLGAFAASPLPLPAEAERGAGALLLFSLADQEIVEVSKPFVAANLSSRQVLPSPASLEDSRRLTSAATNK